MDGKTGRPPIEAADGIGRAGEQDTRTVRLTIWLGRDEAADTAGQRVVG